MPITLQSTAGAFDESFLRKLPMVEEAMLTHGLDPSRFVIAKDRSLFTNARPFGSVFWDYTVFTDGEHFTVTKPNDITFLNYFYERCMEPDETVPTPQHTHHGLLTRLAQWMEQPI
jgi:hypothetical protein